jgi:zinc/manganese transport system substrate-binding protein
MRTALALPLAALLVISLLAGGAPAADKLHVVTTITDLKALTEAVGGSLVDVDSLARGNQNAHDLEVRPSLMVKLRRADALVINGLELDAWVEVVAQGANNPAVMVGAPGRIDASRGIPVLEVPSGRVDRSMGDVHPSGNPHYTLDPGMAPIITQNILEGLTRLAPQHRPAFEKNRQEFLARLDQATQRWAQALAPIKGAKVVVYHNNLVYQMTRFGLTQYATVEDRPGIPPSPGHLAQLIRRMKDEQVKVIATNPWSDQRLAQRVAGEAGAQVVVIADGVGAVKGADTYIAALDYNVRTLAQALK